MIAEATSTFLHVNSVVREVLLAVVRRPSWYSAASDQDMLPIQFPMQLGIIMSFPWAIQESARAVFTNLSV